MITPLITINVVEPISRSLPEQQNHPTSWEPINISGIRDDFGRILTFEPRDNATQKWMLENTITLTALIENVKSRYLWEKSDEKLVAAACYDLYSQLRQVFPCDTFNVKVGK
jgi:hypothetical protein